MSSSPSIVCSASGAASAAPAAYCFPSASRGNVETVVASPPQATKPVPLVPVTKADFDKVVSSEPPAAQAWIAANKFAGKSGSLCVVPGADGTVAKVRPDTDEEGFERERGEENVKEREVCRSMTLA